MKNNFVQRFVMLAMATVLLAACSSGPDVAAYIPKDAIFVADIDLGKVMNEVDVKNIDNISFVKLGRQELRSENPEMAELLDKILKDPTTTGLDLRKDITLFMSQSSGAVVMAAMHKPSKFEAFLKDVAEEGDELSFEKKDGFSIARTDFGDIVYNKEVAIIGTTYGTDVSPMLTLKKDESMKSNKSFSQYWNNRSELSFWLDYGNMMNLLEQFAGSDLMEESGMPKDYWEDMKKATFCFNTFFDKGAIRSEMMLLGFDSKKYSEFYAKFNKDLLKYMPEKSYLFFSMAMNSEKLAEMYSNSKFYEIDFNEPVVADKSLKDIVKALGGSMAFSLFDFVENEETTIMPLMAIVADVKDASTFRTIVEDAGMNNLGGYYASSFSEIGLDIYVAITDKLAYITNSKEAVETFVKGGYSKGLGGSIAAKAKNSYCFYANLDINSYPQSVVSLMPKNVVHLLGEYFESMEGYMVSTTNTEMYLYIKNKKKNSLLATLLFIDENLMVFVDLFDSLGGSYKEDYDLDYDMDSTVLEDYYVEEAEYLDDDF